MDTGSKKQTQATHKKEGKTPNDVAQFFRRILNHQKLPAKVGEANCKRKSIGQDEQAAQEIKQATEKFQKKHAVK